MTEETLAARAAFTAKPEPPAPRGMMRGDGAEINLVPHPHIPAQKPQCRHIPDGEGNPLISSAMMLRELGRGFRE